MSEVRDLAEYYGGLFQWVASPDGDGDRAMVGNTRSSNLVVYVLAKDGSRTSALITPEEAREMAISMLDLLDGVKPTISREDAV